MSAYRFLVGGFLSIVACLAIGYILVPRVSLLGTSYVLAEDDEDDEDDERDDEDDNQKKTVSSTEQSVTTKTTYVVTYKQVEKKEVVLPEEYQRDTDGDVLVDALDPHPNIPEQQYFTDDDDDAVANAFDVYPGEDDLLTLDDSEDQNRDGILDSFSIVDSQ